MTMFNASIYYEPINHGESLIEARFFVSAETDSEARANARALMRDRYAGEVDDSKYVGGITYTVPGVTTAKRLMGRKK